MVHFVPSMLQVFLEEPRVKGCDCLRLVICSGEALSVDLQERFFARFDAELHNLYGPTEASIDVTSWACERRSNRCSVPIGRPIANTQIYILDSHMQPVPIGVPGELHIGGAGFGLARGYVNQPELTAEKFVASPFNSESGSRLYKTGDRARHLPDGNIEFLGRLDNQVKVRGYRTEPGEIEATLIQHPAVRKCVVVARARDSLLEQSLTGYVVLKQHPAPSVAELRSYLKEKLPEYMIPSVFISLDDLPLTPNGKIDRDALPPPDGERPQLDQGFVEPRAEIEELVAQVWRDVLKVEQVGVYDNFFELGGHSLLATRVVTRLRQNFDIDLPLRKLFELPCVAALAEHIAIVLQDKSRNKTPPIVPVSRDRLIPLSFSQQRLWFLHQVDPSMTAYNIPAIFHIEGPFNVGALEEALNAIVARHEILRTNLAVVDGSPVQRILPSMKMLLSIADLSDIPNDVSEARVRQLALEEARQPFDLAGDPLVRARLLRVNEQDHFLILNIHHAVLDGWSMGTLFQELGNLYEVFSEGQPVALPPLPVQFADYAVWQRETIQGDVLAAQLDYWKRQLGDHLPALNVPADYARPATQSFRGARQAMLLSEELTRALKQLSRREGVTLFMTLLAAFNILLSRYSGQDDVIIGSTVAGRSRSEIQRLIGFFVNALPLRTDLSGNPSFLELLKRVREVCLGAYMHQDVPFEKIVEAINPSRDLTRNPLFQVMFNMVDTSDRVLVLQGCEVTKESFFDPEAKFDITLYAPEKNGTIELAIVYNTDFFSESRIAAVLEQFHYLLCQIAQRPEEKIVVYSLVPLSTRALLPDPTEPLDDTWEGAIHELFSRQAERVSDRPAVVDPDELWTYSELDACTNQLANYFIASRIQPKDVIAIYAQRSCPLVLALLGVLKAGAAFVILDPAYPSARLVDYLRIARPKGWVQMDAAGDLPAELSEFFDSLRISCRIKLASTKQSIANFLSHYPESETGVQVNANDPAYIAFTSGSTGEPKGVLGRHGPITHFFPWQEEAFDLSATDRFSLLSGLGYNHLHRDVFTALSLGATLYIPAPEIVKSPDRLTEWIEQNEITVLHLTPALGRLLRTSTGKTLPSMRRIFFGGDVLTRRDVTLTHEIAPNAKIVSFYGATETQRAVGYFAIPEADARLRQTIPLGRGVKDVQLLLLNANGQLTGIGELGELYVRSPHLAAGYLGDDALTEKNFPINLFTHEACDRLYQSGELGRYLPNGNVEWVRRKDRQVSIRGFRVELAEVESALNQHSAVRESAVVARDYRELVASDPKSKTRTGYSPSIENPEFDTRLVAFVERKQEQSPSIEELRCFLSGRLPNYMMPSYFLFVDHLPLSPNGKVDYLGLPPPDQLLRVAEVEFDAPQTDLEQTLAKIISEVLDVERIGRHENFFHIGGHSLLAAQVTARVRDALCVSLDLRTFLETPTVEGLGRQVEVLLGTKLAQVTPDKEREEIEI